MAEVVAKFLEAQGVQHIFGVNGGANLHLIHGVVDATQIKFVPTTHECNAGFAADAYARLRGLGVAYATSGPGATNLVTAIAASYYDSVPVLYITGNVTTSRQGAPLGVRQYGFQETPIVEMVFPDEDSNCVIVKYAWQLQCAEECIYRLEKCIKEMNKGRKGPALLDIPDDVQRADIRY